MSRISFLPSLAKMSATNLMFLPEEFWRHNCLLQVRDPASIDLLKVSLSTLQLALEAIVTLDQRLIPLESRQLRDVKTRQLRQPDI